MALIAKPHSDLNLVIVGKEEIPIARTHLLEEAFSDSDLPFRVAVLDWHVISQDFRKHIVTCWMPLIDTNRMRYFIQLFGFSSYSF